MSTGDALETRTTKKGSRDGACENGTPTPRRSVSANQSPSPEHRQAPGIWAENGDEIHKKRSNIRDIRAWRRGRDSNPRYGSPYTRFPSVLLKPLGHLSPGRFGGGGIRTHVPGSSPGNPISSRARYVHFGTPPQVGKRFHYIQGLSAKSRQPGSLSEARDRAPLEAAQQSCRQKGARSSGVIFPDSALAVVSFLLWGQRNPACSRFRALCNGAPEPCQIRKEAALRGSLRVPQVSRNLIKNRRPDPGFPRRQGC